MDDAKRGFEWRPTSEPLPMGPRMFEGREVTTNPGLLALAMRWPEKFHYIQPELTRQHTRTRVASWQRTRAMNPEAGY